MVSTSEVGKMDSFPDGLVVKKNARVVSLSGDAEEFSPQGCVLGGAPEGKEPESYRDYVPPRDVTGEVFGLSDAAVLTSADFTGAVAPADLARTDVPAAAGMEFPLGSRIWKSGEGLGSTNPNPETVKRVVHCECTRTDRAFGCGGIADPPSAGQPMENTGESGDRKNDRQSHAEST